jgi:predicted aconitase
VKELVELTQDEKSMLEGKQGAAKQKAMEIVVALASIYGAKNLVKVKSVNVSGVSYKNLGDAGIEFLREWGKAGAQVIVPTTLNPAGMDLEDWEKQKIPSDFAEKQMEVIDAFAKISIPKTCTCTPYLIGNLPKKGDHIAWGESSAVCFSNSVIGARTNREGGPSALAAAVCGRTGNFGYHLDEHRMANILITVNCPMKSNSDFGALGQIIGKQLKNDVPLFRGINNATQEQLKALGASLAAWGGVALYHIDGITPEATEKNMLNENPKKITVNSLDEGYNEMNTNGDDIDFVSVGCPHASTKEINQVAELVKDKKLKATLWVTTGRATKEKVPEAVAIIEKAGGLVLADSCVVVSPIKSIGYKHLATNSGKMAYYSPNYCGVTIKYGTMKRCIHAAINGKWSE